MEDNLDFSMDKLQQCSYRYLQQLAKSMSLPSNVKKVYLIEMIYAKKYYPISEVERIVQRVKLERQQLTKVRKRPRRTFTQIESSSSNQSPSPPITQTPKKPAPIVLRCTPEVRQAILNSRINANLMTKPGSDRVLRSFNMMRKPRYLNSILGVVQTQSGSQQSRIEILDQRPRMTSMNVKYRSSIMTSASSQICLKNGNRELVPVAKRIVTSPMRRQRLLSGIYPISQENRHFEVQSVGVRNSEGKISKLNAFIQKPNEEKCNQTEDSPNDIRDVCLQKLNYPNTTGINESDSQPCIIQPIRTSEDKFKVYYHKKIRSDIVRERMNTQTDRLPKINDAFTQFNKVNDYERVTQPLYVQVSEEAERIYNYPILAKLNNTSLLETLYNFKNHFLMNQPLVQIATTTNTKCVYSTPTLTTAAPQRPVTTCSTDPYVASFERDSQYQFSNNDSARTNDGFRFDPDFRFDFRCNEVLSERNLSNSSAGTANTQELGANVTISDMVEDALELISQDGDYMERMGMDLRVQCVICSWAGPKIILEYHIRKEHPSEIDRHDKRDCNITYTLGSLVQLQLWNCRVIELDSVLYILSVKYEQPDKFMATLSSISSEPEDIKIGSVTIFNKVTGEPYTWRGEIKELPPNLPYDNDNVCLTLNLSKMDLLPNSANLQLVNNELVLQSPSKVVFGQLELNDIHIILFVKVYD